MKVMILVGMTLFGAIGSYVPFLLFSDGEAAVLWSILGGLIGGLFGIWASVKIYRALD